METIRLGQGATLFRKGDIAGCLYVLKKGVLAVLDDTGDREVLLGKISVAGTVFGEMGALLKAPRTATIKADRDSEITCIPTTGNKFEATLVAQPELGLKIAITIAERLKNQ